MALREDTCHPNWMEQLPSEMRDEPLMNIAIPGSHDSFTHSMSSNTPIDPGSPKVVAILAAMFGPITRSIVKRWSVTQNLSFRDQLQLGIRYFDLRISTWKGKESLYFVHGLFCCSVIQGLKQILQWLQEHPKEVVLLDFNHFYDMTDKQHSTLIKMISENFQHRLCPPSVGIDNVTLSQLWARGWQVLAFYHHQVACVTSSPVWPGCAIPSVWPNTTRPDIMKQRLEDSFKRGRPKGKFWVNQGILTPVFGTIVCHPFSSLERCLAGEATEALLSFLEGKSAGPSGINIVIADFVAKGAFVSSVLALNKKS